MNQDILETIKRLDRVDEFKGRTIFHLLSSTGEEYGELCKAINLENENLFADEPSYIEAVDLIICGLAVYARLCSGFNQLNQDIELKLKKWEQKQNVSIQQT